MIMYQNKIHKATTQIQKENPILKQINETQ